MTKTESQKTTVAHYISQISIYQNVLLFKPKYKKVYVNCVVQKYFILISHIIINYRTTHFECHGSLMTNYMTLLSYCLMVSCIYYAYLTAIRF